MRIKLFVEFMLTIFILFIVAGDILLPQPYRNESQQIKNNINEFLISLLPKRLGIKLESKSEEDF